MDGAGETRWQVLAVGEDLSSLAAVADELIKAGYPWWPHTPDSLLSALRHSRTNVSEIVLLDRPSGDPSGLQTLTRLRAEGIVVPVVVLTAAANPAEHVALYESGADACLPRPIEFPELVARIEAILRRTVVDRDGRLRANDVELDIRTRAVEVNAQPIELTPIEFTLLELLVRHAGYVVTRRMLCERIWGMAAWNGPTNMIDVHMGRLRRKLDADGKLAKRIVTIRGRGYLMPVPYPPQTAAEAGSLMDSDSAAPTAGHADFAAADEASDAAG